MRTAVVAALLAVLAVGAYGQGQQDDCICRKDVRCFTSLEQCLSGRTPYAFETTSAKICESAPPVDTPVFSCWETPEICRFVSNCTLPTTPPPTTVPPTTRPPTTRPPTTRPPTTAPPTTAPPTTPPPKCQCRTDIKCFSTLADCRAFKGPFTFNGGSNLECAEIDKPVFACWEEPTICRSTETCDVIPNGGGNQDPHFRGFDGSDYYFDGVAGYDYNIISDVSLQLNAHFIRLNQLKGTYMGRLGFRFGEYSLTFDPHFGVFFNNTLMTNEEIETPEGSFVVEVVDERLRLIFQNDVYHVTARVVVEKGERHEAYINIHTAIVGTLEQQPHGILGQTANSALDASSDDGSDSHTTFVIEGAEEDYHVRDGLLGTDFTFNKFTGTQAEPVTATGSRLRRSAPLFEASVN